MDNQNTFCCPNCGLPREDNGVFCSNCGYQIINGQGHLQNHTIESRLRDNAYARKKVAGYSTWWQTEGTERKIVNAVMYTDMVILGLGILLSVCGLILFGIPLIILSVVIFILTFIISALRPSNRKQIKEHGISYSGSMRYKRNPITNEIIDESNVEIKKVNSSTDLPGEE